MKQNKEELIEYFTPLYILDKLYEDGLESPEKYKNDAKFLSELQKFKNQDKTFLNELAMAISDTTGKYDAIWNKAEKLTQKPLMAVNGAKLKKIKKLQSLRKSPKKCRHCGCDMIDSKEKGGKLISKCSCGCSVGSTMRKERGGTLNHYDLDSFLEEGTLASSIVNKWERKINSKKVRKFKG